jgi:hypothetical protein
MYNTNEGWMTMTIVACVFAKRKTVKYVQCSQSIGRSATDSVYCKILVLSIKQVYMTWTIWVQRKEEGVGHIGDKMFIEIKTLFLKKCALRSCDTCCRNPKLILTGLRWRRCWSARSPDQCLEIMRKARMQVVDLLGNVAGFNVGPDWTNSIQWLNVFTKAGHPFICSSEQRKVRHDVKWTIQEKTSINQHR